MRLPRRVKKWLLAFSYVALVVSSATAFADQSKPVRTNENPELAIHTVVSRLRLECLRSGLIDELRRTRAIETAILLCEGEVRRATQANFGKLSTNAIRAFVATIVAGNFAEYGASDGRSFEEIAGERLLSCAQLAFLVGYLYGENDPSLRSIGFDGGAIGNHAQLILLDEARAFLLDPTAGVIAETDFDSLLSGTPISAKKIVLFGIKAASIDAFREKVLSALLNGSYRPSDFMYMHENLFEHRTKGGSAYYFTPGGIYVRKQLKAGVGRE